MNRRIPIIAQDQGDTYYRVGVVAPLDSGKGVLIYAWGTKVSRHRDGRTYSGEVGDGEDRAVRVTFPTSEIRTEEVHRAAIPTSLTEGLVPHTGAPPENSFVIPLTALNSNSSFAAEIVAASLLDETLAAWQAYSATVSAQGVVDHAYNKAIILTVLEPSA